MILMIGNSMACNGCSIKRMCLTSCFLGSTEGMSARFLINKCLLGCGAYWHTGGNILKITIFRAWTVNAVISDVK
jgi:hypothetical protein